MKRAIITVKGEVQRVGYRDFVERIARKLKINGFVENLKPHDVRIVCEGDEKPIATFLKQIDIKKSPVFVENIDAQYMEPTNEFKWFEIHRGEPMEEIGERMDVINTALLEIRDLKKEILVALMEGLDGINSVTQKSTM